MFLDIFRRNLEEICIESLESLFRKMSTNLQTNSAASRGRSSFGKIERSTSALTQNAGAGGSSSSSSTTGPLSQSQRNKTMSIVPVQSNQSRNQKYGGGGGAGSGLNSDDDPNSVKEIKRKGEIQKIILKLKKIRKRK